MLPIRLLSFGILVSFHQFFLLVGAQKLCSFSPEVSNSSQFIQHFSSSKCMRVSAFGLSPNSKVVIDECSYWNKATNDQLFNLTQSPLNKLSMRTDGWNGESYCLTIKSSSSSRKLFNDNCQSSNFDQNWTFKPVKGYSGQFLIEQYSSKLCLIPESLRTGSGITLAPCNSYQTEQIWKLCKLA